MLLRTTTLHERNKQQGHNWTITTPVLSCSFIAMPYSYEGRDLHILK